MKRAKKSSALYVSLLLYFGKIVRFFTSTSLFLVLNFVFVVYFSAVLYDVDVSPVILLLAFFMMFAIYSLNKVTDRVEDAINKHSKNTKYHLCFLISAIVCYTIVPAIGLTLGTRVFLVLLIPLFIGFIYSVQLSKSLHRLKEMRGVKSVAVAFSWALPGALLPALATTVAVEQIVLVFLYIFIQLFINTVLFDIIDMPGDRAAKIKTIPIQLGKTKTTYILLIVNSLVILWLSFCLTSGLFIKYLPVAALGMLYSYGTIWYFPKHENKRLLADILIDGQWTLLLMFLWFFAR